MYTTCRLCTRAEALRRLLIEGCRQATVHAVLATQTNSILAV